MEYYSAIKKEWNNTICSNMDVPTKWSKLDRERQISYDIAYMWNLKKWYKWTSELFQKDKWGKCLWTGLKKKPRHFNMLNKVWMILSMYVCTSNNM